MGTSRTLAAERVTTGVPGAWRSDIGAVGDTIREHPKLLLIGIIGFALRGGLVLLTVPILVLPTQVEVRLALGGNLGSTGLTGGFYFLVAGLTAMTLAVALVLLYVVARCELAAFSRFVNGPALTPAHPWSAPGRLSTAVARTVTTRLFVIESLALLAILVAAIPLAVSISSETLNEILLPSSTSSIYTRVVGDVLGPLAGWLVALVVIEAVSAIAVRAVLVRPFGLAGHMRARRHPLLVVGVCICGWLLFVGALAVGVLALNVVWQAVRAVFLATGLSGSVQDIAGALVVALIFGAVFTIALTLSGAVSIVRAGLWTLASLR